MSEPARPWAVLKRGLRRTCPHCGRGPMLDGWLTTRKQCPVCGLVYERDPGDTWAFWVVGDRIPVFLGVAVVYFGLRPHTWMQVAAFLGGTAGVLIATIPQRMGIVVALHYLSRRRWPNPDDPIPPPIDPADGAERIP